MNEVTSNSSMVQAVTGASSGQAKSSKAGGTTDAGVSATPKASVVVAKESPESAAAQVIQETKLDEAVSRLNDFVQSTQRDLYFNYDDNLGKTVVTVVDRTTDEVIRKIPSEVALQLAEKLNEDEPVRLFSAQA